MLQTSYEAKTKDVWVFIETKDGKARNVGLELLNPGRRLAGIQGGKAVALVIGHNCEDAVKEAIAHGSSGRQRGVWPLQHRRLHRRYRTLR